MSDITIGSGNVFKDLGFPNPDEELAKVKLAYKINSLVEEKGFDEGQAANFLGISPKKMAALRDGRLKNFTIDRLFKFLTKLDYHVEIRVSPSSTSEIKETILVELS